jgi:hypothetical protein
MAQKRGGISGEWFGVMVNQPNVAFVTVTFIEEDDRTFRGSWLFPDSHGNGAKGAFRARKFASHLSVVIRTKPLAHIQCQMSILEENGESMITGVIPRPGAAVPFLTVTLFRRRLEMASNGICPIKPSAIQPEAKQ